MITPEQYQAAMAWMAGNDTGISSEAILQNAMGIAKSRPFGDYPRDPSDLGRCLSLIRLLPWAKEGIAQLAAKSAVWAVYAKHWDELEQSMLNEVGINWEKADTAPKTYDLMQRLQDEVHGKGI